jgi:hypothetical protein
MNVQRQKRTGFLRGIGVGVIGSLVGMALMDLVIVAEYTLIGQPALTYLRLIGSVFGRGLGVGALVHVVLAALLGIVFVLPLLTIKVLRVDSVRKGLLLGLVIGVASIVACVPMALLIRERILTVLAFMFVPHVVWGIGLGIVAGFGLRPAPAT